jgi:mannosyltransferase
LRSHLASVEAGVKSPVDWPPMRRWESRGWAVAALGVALLAVWWRFQTLERRPLWFDERFTAERVERAGDLAELWRAAANDDYQHPPLAYMPAWLAAHGAATPLRLRLPSALAGLASIGLLAVLGTVLFDRWTGLLAAFLMAISIYHVDFSQEARPYMMGLTLTLAQYTALFAYLSNQRARRGASAETGRRWLVFAFAFSAVGAIYTYHLAIVHLGVAIAVALAGALSPQRELRARAGALGLAFAWIALALVPDLANLRGFSSARGLAADHVLAVGPRFFHALVARWGSGDGWVTGLYEVAFGVGSLRIVWRRDAIALGLLGWAAVPFAVFAVVPFSKYFDIRFLISALPVFFLAVAAGAGGAARAAARIQGLRPRAGAVEGVALAAFGVAFAIPAFRLYERFRATDTRCGEFVIRPEVIEADDRFCAEHLVLSTIYAPQQFIVRSLRPSVALDPSQLDAYVGRYLFENGPPIEIRRSGDHLTAQVEGYPEYELVPESETRFFYRVLGQRALSFERDAAGGFSSLLLEGGGGRAHARRVR